MNSILSLFWNIATFRTGPDAVPANRFLLIGVVVADALISLIAQILLNATTPLKAATAVTLNLATLMVLVYMLLSLLNLAPRFVQTVGALIGTDILLTVISVAGLLLAMQVGELLSSIVSVATLFWTLAVFGFIFHKAMNMHIGLGIALAFFSVVLSFAISQAAIA
jgi:hypothetical protein